MKRGFAINNHSSQLTIVYYQIRRHCDAGSNLFVSAEFESSKETAKIWQIASCVAMTAYFIGLETKE
jgi:hypothetical protein